MCTGMGGKLENRCARAGFGAPAVGQHDVGDRTGRHRDPEPDMAAVHPPADLDASVGTVMVGFGPGQSRPGLRLHDESPVSGTVAGHSQTGDVPVQEPDHGAFAVVVEGFVGHPGVIDGVPQFPDGGGTLVEHVQPRRRGGLP